jgi:hypothetical protein
MMDADIPARCSEATMTANIAEMGWSYQQIPTAIR